MKATIVSFGHIDVIIPLYKSLRLKSYDVNLILCFALNKTYESILNFSDKEIHTGFLTKEEIRKIIPKQITSYIEAEDKIDLFIFHNLKLRSTKNFMLAIKLAKRLKFADIIHFNGVNGILPLLIGILRNRRLIFTIHDIKSHSGEKTRFNLAEIINNKIIKSSFPIIVHNSLDKCDLARKHPKIAHKLYYIPFGILDIYKNFEDPNFNTIASDILFFGRISPYKGIEYLIEAIKILNQEGIKVNTVIAGKGTPSFETDDLSSLNIKLLNKHLSNSELVALIKATKVVVCPYTDATQSGVAMTSFAFQKPVIATKVGGFTDVISDGFNGLLVPPKNAKKLAESIKELIIDENKRYILSKNIEEFEKDESIFAWNNISNKVIELYTQNCQN